MSQKALLRILLVGITIVLAYFFRSPFRDIGDDPDRRAYFVCCDDYGQYSVGVYTRVGGGRAAFETIREAAPYMRAGDLGSAAAGLCGFLFKQTGFDGDTGGTLSLADAPKPDADGKIDWDKYGGDGDVIVVNVDQGSAKCCFGSMVGKEIHDLKLASLEGWRHRQKAR
jgi:hypothetical protein